MKLKRFRIWNKRYVYFETIHHEIHYTVFPHPQYPFIPLFYHRVCKVKCFTSAIFNLDVNCKNSFDHWIVSALLEKVKDLKWKHFYQFLSLEWFLEVAEKIIIWQQWGWSPKTVGIHEQTLESVYHMWTTYAQIFHEMRKNSVSFIWAPAMRSHNVSLTFRLTSN